MLRSEHPKDRSQISEQQLRRSKAQKIKSSTSGDCSQKFEELRTAVPVPRKQSKLARTHANLSTIQSLHVLLPSQYTCESLTELYLSHNQISQVRGLSKYINLKALNLSYNHLQSVSECTQQLGQLIYLKRLGLRQNYLCYGYQDLVISKLVDRLLRLDDLILPLTEKDRRWVFQESEGIANTILPAIIKTNEFVRQLSQGKGITESSSNEIMARISIFYRKQQKFVLPQDNLKALRHLSQIIGTLSCFECPGLESNFDYVSENKKAFEELTKKVLTHFSVRRNHHLLRSLTRKQSRNSFDSLADEPNNIPIELLMRRFGQTMGGYKYRISVSDNPGRFIRIVDRQQLQSDHPMIQYVNYQQTKDSWKTLNGDGKTKSTVLRDEIPHYKEKKEQQQLFERFPIVVYEKNYLQVIIDIFRQKIEELLRLHKLYLRNCKPSQSAEERAFELSCPQSGIPPQKGQESPESVRKTVNSWLAEQKLSDIQSVGQSRRTVVNHKVYQARQHSVSELDAKKTQKLLVDRSKQSCKRSKCDGKQSEQSKNLSSYSLHQISLSYKVLRALKRRVEKKAITVKQSEWGLRSHF